MLASNLQDTNNRKRADIVTEEQLMQLAGKIGDWKCLAIGHLGFTKSEVDQVASSRDNQQYQIFSMLHKWRNRQKPPTIQSLIQILEKANTDFGALEYLQNECNTVNVNEVRKISAEAKPPEKNQTGTLILENAQTENLSKEENLFPKIHSKTSKKKDATQLKSEKEGAKTKRKQRKMQAKTFEVLVLSMVKRKPRKCYGCRKQLLDGEVPDLVLKTEDFREYFSGYKQKHLAFQPSNVYFHVNEECVRNKYGPFRQHKFTVPDNVLKHLNSTQITMLKSMNIIQGADDTKWKVKTPEHDPKHGKLMQYEREKVEASPSSQCCQSSVRH
ncbi:uncharacterized protein LOC134357129 isoform X2 [Mobula hypostoma]|uniref:uncharacterized protein LOC134357129 isoform X2 n=1 Tax=Mobula hypostoma TaxID=723540 RepID=UPI002FC35E6F